MGNHSSIMSSDSRSGVLDPDDEGYMTLLAQISSEIDDDYKTDLDDDKSTGIPNCVVSIKSIEELYVYQKALGRGASCTVTLVQSKYSSSSPQYALKQMKKSDQDNLRSFRNEIEILKQLNHPNIVNFNCAYVSKEYYFLTTSYCCGGTLLERIIEMKRFSERDCAGFIKTILQTLQYIHANDIAHRDIKCANIVFDSKDLKKSKLKLIDFGQSEIIYNTNYDSVETHITGSMYYLPPETMRSRKKSELFAGDIWSVGVICYMLLNGVIPFYGKSLQDVMKCIHSGLKWQNNIKLSDSCKDFIESLLCKDTKKRLNAEGALLHKWIINTANLSDNDLGDEYFYKLNKLQFESKLQQIMINAILCQMNETEKKSLFKNRVCNECMDETQLVRDILLSHKKTAKSDYSLSEMDIDNILHEIDMDIKKNQKKLFVPIAKLKALPEKKRVDEDGISIDRFVDILESSPKPYDIPEIVANVTDNGCDTVSFRKISSYHAPIHSL